MMPLSVECRGESVELVRRKFRAENFVVERGDMI